MLVAQLILPFLLDQFGDGLLEICSKCHPFYTGKQKFVDAGGRVDKFKKRLAMVK